MPGKTKIIPPPPANSCQPGIATSLLYNGSKFQGHQKSKGNCYDVEVVLQVSNVKRNYTDTYNFRVCTLIVRTYP